MSMLGRFKHDAQWMGQVREMDLSSCPETVALMRQPREGTKDEAPLFPGFKRFVAAINPDGGKYVMTGPAGWLNSNEAADTIGFAGDAVEIADHNKHWYQVLSLFNFRDETPDPKAVNYQNGDPRVQKFTVVTRDGKMRNPGKGLDAYTLVIARGALFIQKERVELFPQLPMEVTITDPMGVRVRSGPGIEFGMVKELSWGAQALITEYQLRGSSVWGRLEKHHHWIALEWWPEPSYRDPLFFTSWKMETRPPIPPRALMGEPGGGPATTWPKQVTVIRPFTKLYHLPGRAMNGIAFFGKQLSVSEIIRCQKEDYGRTGAGFVLMKDVKFVQ